MTFFGNAPGSSALAVAEGGEEDGGGVAAVSVVFGDSQTTTSAPASEPTTTPAVKVIQRRMVMAPTLTSCAVSEQMHHLVVRDLGEVAVPLADRRELLRTEGDEDLVGCGPQPVQGIVRGHASRGQDALRAQRPRHTDRREHRAFANRPESEFRVSRNAELAHHEDIKGGAHCAGDLGGDGHSPAGDAQHDRPVPAHEFQQCRESVPGVYPGPKDLHAPSLERSARRGNITIERHPHTQRSLAPTRLTSMGIMSENKEGTMRRLRHIGVIAGLIVATTAVLGGCSSSSDSSYGGADAAYDGEVAQEDMGGDSAAAPGAADVSRSSTADRSVIITGAMYMTVEDPIAIADKATGIVQNAGGRIDARSETAPDERNGGSAALTMRIPSNRLDAVVDDLRALGTVDQFSTDSYDVTVEVTDLEAQISTLRASTQRIEALLADAKDIKDIITLENELDGRQAELQSLEARQRGLDDQVSMSTIDLSLTTEPVVIVDDAPETFWDGLVSGWNGLVSFMSGALVVVGVLLPWAALTGLVVVAVIVTIRARRSRDHRRAPQSTAPAAAPVASPPPSPPAA